jgi:hypothetical protein
MAFATGPVSMDRLETLQNGKASLYLGAAE